MKATDEARYREAMRRFDAANGADPNHIDEAGERRPRELVYAERLYRWLLELRPEASEALRLAARSQHLCRWHIPRERFPDGRSGYLQWRTELKRFHAEKSGAILAEVGYPPEMVDRVQALNLKQNREGDAECQALEDALCLVFLEYQFTELAAKTPEDKMEGILRKTWAKMSAQAQERALNLEFGSMERKLLAGATRDAAE